MIRFKSWGESRVYRHHRAILELRFFDFMSLGLVLQVSALREEEKVMKEHLDLLLDLANRVRRWTILKPKVVNVLVNLAAIYVRQSHSHFHSCFVETGTNLVEKLAELALSMLHKLPCKKESERVLNDILLVLHYDLHVRIVTDLLVSTHYRDHSRLVEKLKVLSVQHFDVVALGILAPICISLLVIQRRLVVIFHELILLQFFVQVHEGDLSKRFLGVVFGTFEQLGLFELLLFLNLHFVPIRKFFAVPVLVTFLHVFDKFFV